MTAAMGPAGARILGLGHYRMANEDIAQIVDASDGWIRGRVGVATRHLAAHDESVIDMAVAAAGKALATAGVEPGDIGLVITATCPLESSIASASATVGHLLGAAAAVAAIATPLTVHDGLVPFTRNLDDPDDDIQLDLAGDRPREITLHAAINDSFGFGGHNVALVITAA